MSDRHSRMGAALRFLASGGMAQEDPDVVNELLVRARGLADLVLADPTAPAETRAAARALLDELATDTYAEH